MRRTLPLAALAALALLVAGCGTPAAGPSSATPASGSASAAASSRAASSTAPSSSTHADPAALDVVVNKTRPVAPPDWAPSDLVAVPGSELPLRAEAATAAGDLLGAAAAAGHDLTTLSAYRSYDYQVRTYGHWVDELGRAEADRVSARPGYSEHQTGLAWDVAAWCQALQAAEPGRTGMDEARLARFLQHYERISRQALRTLPALAGHCVRLDRARRVVG